MTNERMLEFLGINDYECLLCMDVTMIFYGVLN